MGSGAEPLNKARGAALSWLLLPLAARDPRRLLGVAPVSCPQRFPRTPASSSGSPAAQPLPGLSAAPGGLLLRDPSGCTQGPSHALYPILARRAWLACTPRGAAGLARAPRG